MGNGRKSVGIIHADKSTDLSDLAALEGVDEITPVSAAFNLVGREFQPEPTVIPVGEALIGGDEFVVMAGPCSVETAEQIEILRRRRSRPRADASCAAAPTSRAPPPTASRAWAKRACASWPPPGAGTACPSSPR